VLRLKKKGHIVIGKRFAEEWDENGRGQHDSRSRGMNHDFDFWTLPLAVWH
jgi:hypothetical protein